SGCYTRGPLTTAVPAPGTRIVAQVTDSGVVALSNALGAGPVEVEGLVAAADDRSWDLQLVRVDYRGGASVLWNRDRVSFPRATLAPATQMRLDRDDVLGHDVLVDGNLAGHREGRPIDIEQHRTSARPRDARRARHADHVAGPERPGDGLDLNAGDAT